MINMRTKTERRPGAAVIKTIKVAPLLGDDIWKKPDDGDMNLIQQLTDSTQEKKHRAAVKSATTPWKNTLRDFCAKSSLHGLQYIGDQHTPRVERILWTLIVLLSMVLVGVMIGEVYNKWMTSSVIISRRILWTLIVLLSMVLVAVMIGEVYNKWMTSPVIVSLDPSETAVWQIPFPAVTLCDTTKARASLFNYEEVVERFNDDMNITAQEKYYLDRVSLACVVETHSSGDLKVDDTVVPTLLELGTGHDMIVYVKWNNKVYNSKEVMHPVLTEEGICYSFNVLDTEEIYTDQVSIHPPLVKAVGRSQWTLTSSYADHAPLRGFPRRSLFSGADRGLSIMMKALEEDHDEICRNDETGFKVILHNPGELPDVKKRFINVPHSTELSLAVTPHMVLTSDNLKDYSPTKRECFFSDERPLRFYREYTYEKCSFECLTNFTLQECGCVAYFMPRVKDMKICGPGSRRCIEEAKNDMSLRNVDALQEEMMQTGNMLYLDAICHCLPSCTDLTYEGETSSRELHTDNLGAWINITDTTSVSAVVIYYKVEHFTARQRSELFGITEFIAYSGGLLGLFLGFSFLSVCEIVYFASNCIFNNLRRRREESPESYGVKHFSTPR